MFSKTRLVIVFFTTIAINIIAGASSLLELMYEKNMCSDLYGVSLPYPIWIEWIACVPLMALCSSLPELNGKNDSLNTWNKLFIGSLWLCIIFGAVMALSTTIESYIICCFLSFSCFLCPYYIWYRGLGQKFRIDSDEYSHSQRSDTLGEIESGIVSKEKEKLKSFMIFVLPSFPLIYILAVSKLIDQNSTLICFNVANVIAKFIFSTRCCDVHIGLVQDVFNILTAVENHVRPCA